MKLELTEEQAEHLSNALETHRFEMYKALIGSDDPKQQDFYRERERRVGELIEMLKKAMPSKPEDDNEDDEEEEEDED